MVVEANLVGEADVDFARTHCSTIVSAARRRQCYVTRHACVDSACTLCLAIVSAARRRQ